MDWPKRADGTPVHMEIVPPESWDPPGMLAVRLRDGGVCMGCFYATGPNCGIHSGCPRHAGLLACDLQPPYGRHVPSAERVRKIVYAKPPAYGNEED